MANLIKEGLLNVKWIPRLDTLRFRRVNVQKPRAPHYERAKYMQLVEPVFKEDESIHLPPSLKCKKAKELQAKNLKIDNPLERIIAKELYEKFEATRMVAFLHVNPISGEEQFQAKVLLKRQGMEIGLFGRKTVERAITGTIYEAIRPLFVSNQAIVFSSEPHVDKLIKVLKKVPQYILLAGIIDQRLLSVSQLKKYAEIKNVTTSRSGLVLVLNSFAQHLVNNLTAHPQNLAAQLQLYADTKSKES